MNNYTSLFSLLMLGSSLSLRGGDLVASVQIDGHSHLVIKTNEMFWNLGVTERKGVTNNHTLQT